MKGYFDESKREPDGKIFALAGYVGHVTGWRRQCREWNNILRDYGKSDLHMKELAGCTKQFADFKDNEPKRREFLGKLVRTLYKEPRFVAVGCSVNTEDFANLPDEKVASFRHDPYLFAFVICVRGVLECPYFRDLPASERIGFVFDRREDFQARALSLFTTVKEMPTIPYRERLGDIAFSSRMESPPLQAADFAAYEVRKDLEREMTGQRERWGIQQIKSGASCGVYIFDGDNLRKWFRV